MSDVALNPTPVPSRLLYPQAEEQPEGSLERIVHDCWGFVFRSTERLHQNRYARIVPLTEAAVRGLGGLNEDALATYRHDLGVALRRSAAIIGRFRDGLVGEVFALVCKAAKQSLGLSPTDDQLMGGAAVLAGNVVEMEAGEGKTLTATLAACVAGLTGMPTHVVCANDDLARRDGERMAPLYQALGLSVGIIGHGDDNAARRQAYRCSVTYGTSAEFAFDHLRDRMVLGAKSSDIHLKVDRLYGETGRTGKLLMRGLGFAVVDDADTVLLDQARAPQSISGTGDSGNEEQIARRAFAVADALEADTHFQVFKDNTRIEITDHGKAQIQNLIDQDDALRTGPAIRIDTVREALMARHLFFRDEHYILRDGRILILDEQTGQPTDNRQWMGGLQQLIEVKEGCEPSDHRVILARMSYQRYFQRYLRFGGLSDTAREAAAELWKTYRLLVIAIPGSRDMHRQRCSDRVFATASERLQAIVERAIEIADQGRPVFIAAPTAEAAKAITECLTKQGVAHNDLAAAQPDEVAGIFADAGQPGVITVSANMAGVGMGIVPAPDSARSGGLHVIIAEPHDSRRADRWLAQRCGRGGTAGSHELFLSLEDPMVIETGGFAVDIASRLFPLAPDVGRWAALYAVRGAQRKIERKHARLRWDLLIYDRETSKLLAFSGRNE